jgi:hypothetical protein
MEVNVEQTNKELVIEAHAHARCVTTMGAYQIRMPSPAANYTLLSSQHTTEEAAWSFAAARVRIQQEVKGNLEENMALVLRTFPQAYCVNLRGYHQIRRPRTASDKVTNLDFVSLSGRYSLPEFAWQEAAQRIR